MQRSASSSALVPGTHDLLNMTGRFAGMLIHAALTGLRPVGHGLLRMWVRRLRADPHEQTPSRLPRHVRERSSRCITILYARYYTPEPKLAQVHSALLRRALLQHDAHCAMLKHLHTILLSPHSGTADAASAAADTSPCNFRLAGAAVSGCRLPRLCRTATRRLKSSLSAVTLGSGFTPRLVQPGKCSCSLCDKYTATPLPCRRA
jgi:hypothetical protein